MDRCNCGYSSSTSSSMEMVNKSSRPLRVPLPRCSVPAGSVIFQMTSPWGSWSTSWEASAARASGMVAALSTRPPGVVLIVYMGTSLAGQQRWGLVMWMLSFPRGPVQAAGENVDESSSVDPPERVRSRRSWVGTGGDRPGGGLPAAAVGGCLAAQDDRAEFGDVPPGVAHRVGCRLVPDGPGQRPDPDDR